MKKVFFAYPANRNPLQQQVKRGTSPDNALYGLNYMRFFGFNAATKDVSEKIERILDYLLSPLIKLFFSQINIDFKLGRALLLLPAMSSADIIVVNTDGIALAVCFLKRIGLIKKPVIYAVGLFYIEGHLEKAVRIGKETIFKRFFKWVILGADQILYHAEIEKEKLIKLGVYNPAKCTFVPMGSDSEFFDLRKFTSLPTLKNTVVAIGKDRARDYKTLLEVARQLPKLSFIIICRKENLQSLIVPSNVQTYFNIPYNQTAAFYKRATLVVIPIKEMNRSSGQMTLTDCLQCSKPVVISDVKGIRHYPLKNNENVMLVKPQNIKSLKDAITILISNKNLQKKLIKGTKILAAIYSTRNYTKQLAKVIETFSNKFRLKPIAKSNLEFLRRIRNENYNFFISKNKFISRENQLKWFSQYLASNNDYMYILTLKDKKIGVAAIYNINDKKKTAEIGRFIIDQKFRNRGYGKVLIEKIEYLAFEKMSLDNLMLKVLKENKSAIHLYKSLGYVKQQEILLNGKKLLLMTKTVNLQYNCAHG